MLNNVLNISPRLSAQALSNSIVMSENTVASVISIPSTGTPAKSSDALRKEIATLESEILHLERYLLSLYRTAYEEHLPATSNVAEKTLPSQVVANQSHDNNVKPCIETKSFYVDQTTRTPAHCWISSDDQSCSASSHSTSTRDRKNADSARRSLADHLGASCLLDSFNTPDRLSEDILKCISSIYCRLANPPHCQGGSLSSPPSSFSSSSIFSSRNPCDNWSPQYSEDPVVNHQGLKEEVGPYASMVEVLKICFDDDSFNYAAVMLKTFRSLVRSLEKVDPTKMKREEKLAFWINIHNALIMHAYLAYGTRSRVKGASISKATYNVGGHCITACTIQSSIFGIRSNYSEPWLQNLFSPGRKSKTGSVKHVYALEYPEPLVHFALCTGTYSDPAVRVFTAKNIFQELKLAKEEFIQASVYIHKDTKIFLPKLLSYFAKDVAMDVSGLLEAISGCLTEEQQRCMRKCMRRKVDKFVHWLPQSSSFRYVIHGELAKGR
ncbi:uncharacterized protein [Euphorbia lathyris]|uniref:uncharacterized protein n=1 Tax=Euphorbia lathyris TaxID=212925 RepID=UPI003313E005